MKRRPRLVLAVLAIPLLALGGLAACGDDDGDDDGSGTTTSSTTPGTGTATSPSTSADDDEVAVRAYFVRDEKVATAGRTVRGPAVARGAMEALLAGPDGFESGIGMTSVIPPGTVLRGLDIAGGVATVDLSGAFASGGGSLSMQLRVAQVVFTLTQFDTVDTVTIHLDGEPALEGIGGEGVPATGLDRLAVEAVTPAVLVESPVPGATVTSPVRVAGISNTFEATVRWSITDPDGLILDEGFTTATSGTGTWGTFSFEAEFSTSREGLGTVLAFEESAENGAPINVYEVPVRMG